MNSANHIPEDDLALIALQLLPEAEMTAALEHLRECADCRQGVAELNGDLMVYALTAELQSPPAAARERLLNAVAHEKKPIPIDRPQPTTEGISALGSSAEASSNAQAEPERDVAAPIAIDRPQSGRRVAPALAWAGWAVAAGLALTAGLEFHQRQLAQGSLNVMQASLSAESAQLQETTVKAARAQKVLQTITDVDAMQVALHLPAEPGATPKPEAHAAYVANRGALVFVASNLQPLQDGKTYELWLLPAVAGQTPVAAGLFKPDAAGNASVVLPNLPKGITAKGFGVTVENAGGSSTPTLPIVLAG